MFWNLPPSIGFWVIVVVALIILAVNTWDKN